MEALRALDSYSHFIKKQIGNTDTKTPKGEEL
jgi:hypothetical protein